MLNNNWSPLLQAASHSRLWCLIALSRLRMRAADYPFLSCFNNRKMFRVHWNNFNKNEMKQLTITDRRIFKFYSRGISCSSTDNEKEQVQGDSSPLLIGWNHHFLRIREVDSNICGKELILMYDATNLSDENKKPSPIIPSNLVNQKEACKTSTLVKTE